MDKYVEQRMGLVSLPEVVHFQAYYLTINLQQVNKSWDYAICYAIVSL